MSTPARPLGVAYPASGAVRGSRQEGSQGGGGPLLAVDCGTDVRIENEAGVAIYPSSAWAERGFCRQCGTHLFYRFKERASYFVPVGVFGDAAPWKLEHQIFIDEKPGFYAFANPTTNMTGAQVFAQFQQQK